MDFRWQGEDHGWLVSGEWYVDDLQGEPDGIEVLGYRPSVLMILDRLGQMLAALQQKAQPPVVQETLDLRDRRSR